MASNDPDMPNIFPSAAIKLDDKNLKNRPKAATASKSINIQIIFMIFYLDIKDVKLGSILPVELFEPGRNKDRYQTLKKELENKKQIVGFKEARFISLEECENILEATLCYYQDLYGKYIIISTRLYLAFFGEKSNVACFNVALNAID